MMKPREALINPGILAVIEWEICEMNEALRHNNAGFRYHLKHAETEVAKLARQLLELDRLGKEAPDATDEPGPAPIAEQGNPTS